MPKPIVVDVLARVEGEGALEVHLRDGLVADVKLRIPEPPRLFEALLVGRRHDEAPDITARICGICPVAYQMSAVHAMEAAFGVSVPAPVRALRRLLYCGEWIESHALHIYLLHAPDFLGYEGAVEMAQDHAHLVQRGLALKKVGNDVMIVVGGREIHPVNVRVGGFHKAPAKAAIAALADPLARARDAALETLRWTAGFDFPDLESPYEFLSLCHPSEYPMNEGEVRTSGGLSFPVARFEEHVAEEQVPHSHALHAVLRGRGAYLVGPLARYALNADRLSPLAREAAREVSLERVCRNPFRSILVRGVELVHACDEALRLVAAYEPPEPPAVAVTPRAGTGAAATEAPRGLLYHRYDLDASGVIRKARIVPPTSQNQKSIEADVGRLVPAHINDPHPELTLLCERAVRNHDPCISCATHFLKLEVVPWPSSPSD